MTPQTVNAYYNPTFNEIVFPAAYCSRRFSIPTQTQQVNYGGIGGSSATKWVTALTPGIEVRCKRHIAHLVAPAG